MDFDIEGKTALLISSTRGLGFGCAQALVAEGVQVVVNGRNDERGIKAVSILGEKAHFVQADVNHPDERLRLFNEAQSHLGKISILVTNVDGPASGTFMSKSINDWKTAFELLMLSALDLVQKCLPGMIEQGFGRIVSINSVSAKEITPGTPLSNGIKPGLIGALGTLAREVGVKGVTVNSILPGPFYTDLLKQNADKYTEQSPMKRIGTIEEFGALCAFLCSQQAGYITGQSIVIDGGQVTSLF